MAARQASDSATLHRELTELAERGEAVLLAELHAGRVVWATPAGAALLGAASPEAAISQAAPLPGLPLDHLLGVAAGLAPNGAVRLERVRAVIGRRARSLTLALRKVVLPRLGEALLLVAPGETALRRGNETPSVHALFEPAPAPASAASGLEAIRRRNGGRDVRRFLWHSDAQDRVTFAEPGLAAILGETDAPRAGEAGTPLSALGLCDPSGGLQAAFAARKTFTGVEALWPVADVPEQAVAMTWSGTPVADPGRAFAGFRGFGLVRLNALHPLGAPAHAAPAAEGQAPTAPKDDPGAPPAAELPPAAEPPPAPNDTAIAGLSAPTLVSMSEPKADPAPGSEPAHDTNVVALRPAASAPRLHEPPGLTRSERHAFREIARALGARIEGEPPVEAASATPAAAEPVASEPSPAEPRAAEPPSAEPPSPQADPAVPVAAAPAVVAPAPDEPASPRSTDDATLAAVAATEESRPEDLAVLLDRLPIGVMVSRGEVPILMNRTLLELLDYADADAFYAQGGIGRLFKEPLSESAAGEEQGGPVAILTRNGETLTVDARLATMNWQGLPATVVSFRRAIEPRADARVQAAEHELARRETEIRELRSILDTATDGVVVLDEAGRIVSINRAGEALFGYDQKEVKGETFISLFAPDSHAAALDYLEGLKATGVASLLNDGREVVGRVRQGGRIPLFMTLGAVSETPERRFCAVLRDITPWKKAEGDLVEARKAAEAASAQKSDFLAKISHEVRTPLSAIIGFAEVMMEERFGPVGNERYLEYLRDIHASGGHVISLVNDLLDLSKIEAGRFDLTFVSVDVNEVVSRCVAMMQPQAGTGRVVLRSSLSPRVPAVVADERSLRQIVLNILSNAIKFTDPGGQVIVSTTFTERGEVVIRVRDTGIGMSEKEIETALEPFRQIATARRTGGTGLGLPLTKALVEANRASLTIRSAKDAGTLVEVTFPTTRVLAE